ncbi:MBL fold metallo-hydrolase [Chondrinema litorale]|uniref:MBL fold metallo-hydrolase n=1 Tax=Chondrinema litorale TaxID=2994555 RepID=UPI0025434D6E|nr:MBL fold metallo-hydrolase [Chondrinema litorale]UZR94534.1 MBL fold metallo-hydrolase [Chondrinema litorale]
MKVTFLGTGTSQGVPVIGSDDPVCLSIDFRDKRLRSSILIENDDQTFVIDTGPDFRQQMLRERIKKLDAVIFTHQHKDHTAGLDDIRSFYFKQEKDMPVYAKKEVIEQLKMEFAYMFAQFKYPGVASLDIHEINNEPFRIGSTTFTPIEVLHYKLPIYGYRIKDFTYITDAKYIDDKELEKVNGSKILVLNTLQHDPHISHLTLSEALEIIKKVDVEQVYLTHISYKLGFHAEVSKELPEGVHLAYDGLKLNID